MRKMWKRIFAAAMAVCMTVAMATTAGAFSYRWQEEDEMGEMVQFVVDYEQGLYDLFVVRLVAVGSTVEFSEPVDVAIYAEGEYGVFAPKTVTQGVTSYTIPDAINTYIFIGADGSMTMFRGAASKQAPVTLLGDFEGNGTMKLSNPVQDIEVETLETYDFWEGTYGTGNYLVYEVPVGTTITPRFGSQYILLMDMWDADGKMIQGDDYTQACAERFPDAENGEFGVLLPLTLNEPGYYDFAIEALSTWFPVIKVVEETKGYTLRTAAFSDMNWSKDYVEKVYAYGWMEGMGGDKFEPTGNLTVAQAITLAARLHSAQVNEPIPAAEGAWYQCYVDYCLNNRLLWRYYDEYSESEADLMARMNEKISRLDMVKILGAAADLPGLGWSEEETVTVPDVSKDVDGGDLVYDWYRNGILTGDAGTGNFRPNDNINRGEVAAIMCRLLGL